MRPPPSLRGRRPLIFPVLTPNTINVRISLSSLIPRLLQAPAVSAFPIGGELTTSLPTPRAGTEFTAFDADGTVETLRLVAPDAITRGGMFRKGKRDHIPARQRSAGFLAEVSRAMVIGLLQDGAQRVYLAACGQGRQRYVADFSIVHSIEKMRYNPDSMAFECSYNGDGRGFYTINSADMGFSDEQQGLKFRSRLLTRPGVSVNAPFGSRTSRPNVPTTVESPTMPGGDGHCVGLSLLALGHRIEPVLSQRYVKFVPPRVAAPMAA